MPKKLAARYYRKAREFNRAKVVGRYGGALGSSALRVLETLLFEFLNFATGRLDPSYEGIALKTGLGRSTVAEALRRLKSLGIITWLRRCSRDYGQGQFRLRQERNAYAVLPPSQWRGFSDPKAEPPPPHPTSWSATPPMPDVHEQGIEDMKAGASLTAVASVLECEPDDPLAKALANLARSLALREASVDGQTGVQSLD